MKSPKLTPAEKDYRKAHRAYQRALDRVKPYRDAYLAAVDAIRVEVTPEEQKTG